MRLYKHFITLVLLLNFGSSSLDPTNDIAFKRIFGTEEHKPVLINFLNSILQPYGEEEIIEVKLENTDILPDTVETKLSILDILATTNKGIKIDIEIQLKNSGNMVNRSIFYFSKLAVSLLKKGESYHKLPRFIMINLLGYNYFVDGTVHRVCSFTDESTLRRVSDGVLIHIIELNKVVSDTLNSPEDALLKPEDAWLKFLNNPDDPILAKADPKQKELQKQAKEDLILLHNQNVLFRNTYEARQKFIRDEIGAYNHAIAEGKAEGLKEGTLRTWYDDFYNEETAEFDRVPRSLAQLDVSQLNQYIGLVDSIEEIGDKPRFKDAIRVAKRTRPAEAEGPIAKRAHH